jgi:hypothetical protein
MKKLNKFTVVLAFVCAWTMVGVPVFAADITSASQVYTPKAKVTEKAVKSAAAAKQAYFGTIGDGKFEISDIPYALGGLALGLISPVACKNGSSDPAPVTVNVTPVVGTNSFSAGTTLNLAPNYTNDWGNNFSASDVTWKITQDGTQIQDSANGDNGTVSAASLSNAVYTFKQTFYYGETEIGSRTIYADVWNNQFDELETDASGTAQLSPEQIAAVTLEKISKTL